MLGLYDNGHGNVQAAADRAEAHFEVTSTQGFLSVFPAMTLAEALARAGRRDAALILLNRTVARLSEPQAGLFVSELWRQRGELGAGADGPGSKAVENDLRTAVRIATTQGGAVYRLRAVRALARLLAAGGRLGEARSLLAQTDAAEADPELEEVVALRALAAGLGAGT